MPPVVLLRAAVALTGRFPALAGADLTVGPGEGVIVEGPNGAGKTTLLRACAGLLPVSAGEAVVLGVDLRVDRVAVRRKVGFLGHAAGLYDDLSVVENVRFFVRAAGGDVAKVDGALARLGLEGRLRQTAVGRLSAGQRRRVALAILVARHADLWLLDEPHAALDTAARELLGELVAEHSSRGTAVLLTSHELEVSEPLGHRVVSMVGGRVTAQRAAGATRMPGAAGRENVPGRSAPPGAAGVGMIPSPVAEGDTHVA